MNLKAVKLVKKQIYQGKFFIIKIKKLLYLI
jgi:hypothetical protein